MRIGLIGLGRIGAFHAETLTGLGVDLVVTDTLPEATERVARKYRAEPAADPAALLAAGVGGVVIAAATDAHPELLVAAAEAGVPVFCEKPVARTMAEGLAVARRVAGTDAPIQIGYPRRFDTGFAAVRQAIASGELGWVHTVRSTTLDPAPPPPGYLAVSGGIFRDCSIHDFDAVRWVTGREVIEVYATGSDRGDPVFADLGDVAFAATVLTLDDGARAVVSNSRYNARGHDVRMEVHGSEDSIAAGLDERLPLRSAQPGVTFPGGTPYVFFMDRFAAAFRASLAAFTEVIAGTRPSPCTIEDALETGWVAEAATLSLAEHRPVRIDEVREPVS